MNLFNPSFQRGQCQYCRSRALPDETVCQAHHYKSNYEEEKDKQNVLPIQPQLIDLPKETIELDTKQVIKMTIPDRLNPAEFYIKTRETQKEIIACAYKVIGVEIEKDSNAGKFTTTYTIKNCADYLFTTLWSLLEEDGFDVVVTRNDVDTVFIITWKDVSNDKFMAIVKKESIGDSLSKKCKDV